MEGRALELKRRKQRSLLALLLLRAGEVLSTDQLVEELWAGRPPKAAVGSLQNLVSELRKAIGPETVRTREPGYVLDVDPERVDLNRFERLVALAGETEEAASACLPASRGSCSLARAGARRPRARAVRSGRDRPARGAPHRCSRGPARRRARARPARAARRRARGPGLGAPAAGATARPVDARALQVGQAGRGARGLPGGSRDARRGARHRALSGAPAARAGDPAARPGARPSDPGCRVARPNRTAGRR